MARDNHPLKSVVFEKVALLRSAAEYYDDMFPALSAWNRRRADRLERAATAVFGSPF